MEVMHNKKSVGIILFALLGACLATVCDGVHVHTHTLAYPDPFLFGQAWWVFPGFVMMFLFMEYAYSFIVVRLPAVIPAQKSASRGNARDFIEAVTAFALVYLLSGFGNFEPALLSVIFYGTFVLRWLFSYDRLWLIVLAVAMAFGGMFVEGLYAAAGLMTYRYVDVFHVPFWLGGLYVHGAFALREGMRYFVYDSKSGASF
jgi:hypothetical protein